MVRSCHVEGSSWIDGVRMIVGWDIMMRIGIWGIIANVNS
jgi:hypothetical protein